MTMTLAAQNIHPPVTIVSNVKKIVAAPKSASTIAEEICSFLSECTNYPIFLTVANGNSSSTVFPNPIWLDSEKKLRKLENSPEIMPT